MADKSPYHEMIGIVTRYCQSRGGIVDERSFIDAMRAQAFYGQKKTGQSGAEYHWIRQGYIWQKRKLEIHLTARVPYHPERPYPLEADHFTLVVAGTTDEGRAYRVTYNQHGGSRKTIYMDPPHILETVLEAARAVVESGESRRARGASFDKSAHNPFPQPS